MLLWKNLIYISWETFEFEESRMRKLPIIWFSIVRRIYQLVKSAFRKWNQLLSAFSFETRSKKSLLYWMCVPVPLFWWEWLGKSWQSDATIANLERNWEKENTLRVVHKWRHDLKGEGLRILWRQYKVLVKKRDNWGRS